MSDYESELSKLIDTDDSNLVPTLLLRWRRAMLPADYSIGGPFVLQQWFANRREMKEDGTPASGIWIDVQVGK